jgi:hypothetical protein
VHKFEFFLPDDFADYEWECESKGWFSLAQLTVEGKTYCLIFFDPSRLAQAIVSEHERGNPFYEANLIVVPSITAENMSAAARWLVESGEFASLAPG